MWTVFLFVGVPILFVMTVWVIVTALRILRPEDPVPLEQDPVFLRRQRLLRGAAARVRFQEIRELERDRAHAGPDCDDYLFADGASMGIPVSWYAELDSRRN